MRIKANNGLRYTIPLEKNDGTIYRTKNLSFEQLTVHIRKENKNLRKIKLGNKYVPYIPNYRNPRIPIGEIVLLNTFLREGSRASQIPAYECSFRKSILLEPGQIGLVLGYKYYRLIITYADSDETPSGRFRKINPERTLKFATINRYAVVLVGDRKYYVWEGNLKHVPPEQLDILPKLQEEIVQAIKKVRK